MASWEHPPNGLLSNQDGAKCAHCHRTFDLCGYEVDKRSASPRARVIDHNIRFADLALDLCEKTLHLDWVGSIASKGMRADLVTQGTKFLPLARGQTNTHTLPREQSGQRSAQAFAGAHNESGLMSW